MLADGLVDALHPLAFPLALGTGRRLFATGGSPTKLALSATDVYDSGAVHLAYRPAATAA